MGGEHVVEHHDVAGAPVEAHGDRLVEAADLVHHRVLDRRAVAVEHVARHPLRPHEAEEVGAHLGVEAARVVQLHLVEERLLAGQRVGDHRRAARAGLERVRVEPGEVDALGPAARLHGRAILGVEEPAPVDVEALREGADVDQPQALEAVGDRRRQLPVQRAAVDDGRRAAHRRRLLAEEPLLARPGMQVAALVVVEDHLPLGVGRRAVGVLPALVLGQVAVPAVEAGLERLGEGLEFLRGRDAEAAQQQAGVAAQLALDPVALGGRPGHRVDVGRQRLDHEGEVAPGRQGREAGRLARGGGGFAGAQSLELVELRFQAAGARERRGGVRHDGVLRVS